MVRSGLIKAVSDFNCGVIVTKKEGAKWRPLFCMLVPFVIWLFSFVNFAFIITVSVGLSVGSAVR
ncbi:MAG TPA: hypothetical protein DIW64_06825 [Cellvibrio sp.]|nr:hypothetical protein [Cellvibrio sp.]